MTTPRPFFLITNDDGIEATGLQHLWQAVQSFADCAIVAPDNDQSGCGVAITSARPLVVNQVPWEGTTSAWRVNGTTVDCVKMGLSVLLNKRRPDLILSGVNRGSNAGRAILSSGTVGGVIEGAMREIPGIAFSFFDFDFPPVGSVERSLRAIIQYFLNSHPPIGTFLNVTLPQDCQKGIKGFRMARQGRGYWTEKFDRRVHPEGVPYYWLGGQWSEHVEEPNSEVALLREGYLTAVPIHVGEWTHRAFLDQHQELFKELHLAECPK
jgi:5'-nucleotidase